MIYKKKNLGCSIGRVYYYLFDAIIHNTLKPGDALSEAEIAATLKSSRTPVREAMMILESEGLVTRYPSRGCFVAQISERDVKEIFELRILLETCALRRSYSLIDAEQLNDLEKTLLALTPDTPVEEYFESDRELHTLLLSYCGNGRLIDFLGILNAQIERLRVISAGRPNRLAESRLEHLELTRALRLRDLPLAERLLADHIAHVRDSTLAVCKYMHSAQDVFVSYKYDRNA
ncbi:MAG: GntR family transcriptional regulator [Desulfovibrio sp.]|jgi:DNA-binding GntR family transcriptional regulator|nr:GntR family transcriptional regulator [Desulfovibrio sp.]